MWFTVNDTIVEWVSGVFKLFFFFLNVSLLLSFAIMNAVILCYYDVFFEKDRRDGKRLLLPSGSLNICVLVSVLSSSLHHQTNRDF